MAAIILGGLTAWGKTSEQGQQFWQRYGDFISPLGRAIVTGDWKGFGYQAINILGIVSGNPWIAISSGLSYASRATANIGGSAATDISRGLGYASLAASAIGLGLDLGKSVKNWSDMSKFDKQVGDAIGKVSKLEQTTENSKILGTLNMIKGATEKATMALAIKPLATIGGVAAGVAISGSLSDWDAQTVIGWGIKGGKFGYNSSGTQVGLTKDWMGISPRPESGELPFDEVENFYIRVTTNTKIYGIPIHTKTHSLEYNKGSGWSYSASETSRDERRYWTPILF